MISNEIRLKLNKLNIDLYADSGAIDDLIAWSQWDLFSGLTSNPSLLKQAGATDYIDFAQQLCQQWTNLPMSFGTISDSFAQMVAQAKIISSWGSNVYVKIPVLNSNGEMAYSVIQQLAEQGIKVNITCLMDLAHIENVLKILPVEAHAYLSIFAGRIADTGINPATTVRLAKQLSCDHANVKVLWASTRELYNIFEAEQAGCDIITLNKEIIKKIPLIGKDLGAFSLETVNMFHRDAEVAGYKLIN